MAQVVTVFVPEIRLTVQSDLGYGQIQVQEGDTHRVGVGLQRLVSCVVPVIRTGAGDEEQGHIVGVTVADNAVQIDAVEQSDLSGLAAGLHIVFDLLGKDGMIRLVAPVGLPIVVYHRREQKLRRHTFPAVVNGKDGEKQCSLSKQTVVGGHLPKGRQRIHHHQLGMLVCSGFQQKGVVIIQRASADSADIGSKAAGVPHLQRRVAGVSLAVSQEDDINGVVRLTQKSVKPLQFHAGVLGIVSGPQKESGPLQKQRQKQQKGGGTEAAFLLGTTTCRISSETAHP